MSSIKEWNDRRFRRKVTPKIEELKDNKQLFFSKKKWPKHSGKNS